MIFESALKVIGVLFTIELILGGSGFWSSNIGLPVRKILFALLAGLLVFKWFGREKCNTDMDFLILLSITGLIVWVGLIPLLHGIPSEYSVSDSLPLVGLLLIFISYDYFEHKPKIWENFSNILFWLTLVIGLIHILIYTISLVDYTSAMEVTGLLISLLDPSAGEGEGSSTVTIGMSPDGRFRVMWISSVFLLLSLYLSVKRLGKRQFITGIIGLLVSILAIYSTGTRGFVFGIVIGASQALFLYAVNKRFKPATHVLIFWGVLFLFLNVIILLPLYSPDFLSMIGTARSDSDHDRYEQIQSLFDAFTNHFVLGNGFGATANIVRSSDSPFSYEVSILALYMKLGIVGIALVWFIVYRLTCNIFSYFSIRPSEVKISILYGFVSAFVVASNTNPYLSSFVGLGIILFIYYELMNIGTTEMEHKR
jgi:hypothetical protein